MEKNIGAIELANNLKQAAMNHLHSVFGDCEIDYLCATKDGEIVLIRASAGGKIFEISVKMKNLLA